MKILTVPHPGLREKSAEVLDFSSDIHILVEGLFKTCDEQQGKAAGMSAPQVGVNKRVIVITIPGYRIAMINPVIDWRKGKDERLPESCFSVPGVIVPVERATKIKVSYQDGNGKKLSLIARNLFARVIQHEIDHLNGILITDYQEGRN